MQGFEEGATHTAEAFLDFTYDFLKFAMPRYGYPALETPKEYKRSTKKLFTENFGDVVVLFRERHKHHFLERFNFINEMEETEDILLYVARCQEKIFKGDIPLMELIAFLAFLLDISLICYRLEDPDLLYNVINDTESVFRLHIQPYFTTVGGWHALYRVAEQYASYITSEPRSFLEKDERQGRNEGYIKDDTHTHLYSCTASLGDSMIIYISMKLKNLKI